MMMEFANKKNVKVISLIIAAIFVIGVFVLSLTQSNFGKETGVSDSAIGCVEYQNIMRGAPGLNEVQVTMREEVTNAQKEFDEKSKGMNDADKSKLMKEYQEKLTAKEKELLDPVTKKVNDAIAAVGKRKGLVIVVDKSTVVYGGADVTADVTAEPKKSK